MKIAKIHLTLVVLFLMSLYYIDAMVPNITACYWRGVGCIALMLAGEWVSWIIAAQLRQLHCTV